MSIQTGALWSPARLAEAGIQGPEGGHVCPLCGEPNVDEGHLFWQCPKVCQSGEAAIQKTNRNKSEYQRVGLECKCYWWRGLQPYEQTQPIHKPQASYHMLGAPIGGYEDEHIEVFMDGSGGRHSSDARLRRYAWAWVCPTARSNTEVLHGTRGPWGANQLCHGQSLLPFMSASATLKTILGSSMLPYVQTARWQSIVMPKGRHIPN